MPLTDSSEGFSGLQQWSEPLIFDRLLAAYRGLLTDDPVARDLSRLHARVWRALICGDTDFERLREALVSALDQAGLRRRHLVEVDAEIVIELLEVVVSRCRRSPRAARTYHLALMELAARLRPEKRATARAAA